MIISLIGSICGFLLCIIVEKISNRLALKKFRKHMEEIYANRREEANNEQN